MEKNTIRLIKWTCLIFSFIALLIFTIVFYTSIVLSRNKLQSQNDYNPDDTCLYHIIITGTYENQTFLRQLYKGASKLADSYNAVVELVVPKSQADTTSIQNLLDSSIQTESMPVMMLIWLTILPNTFLITEKKLNLFR